MCTPKHVFALHHVCMRSYTHVQLLPCPDVFQLCCTTKQYLIQSHCQLSLSLSPPPPQSHHYQATSCNQDMCVYTFSCLIQTRAEIRAQAQLCSPEQFPLPPQMKEVQDAHL